MDFTVTFIKIFFWGVYLTYPILLAIVVIIISLGLIVGRIESWTKFNSIYWSFITALTVGYGDMKPISKASKILSIIVGSVGIMLGGILVAITLEATTNAFEVHTDPLVLERMKSAISESDNKL
ncbi:MAG: voltage-gated potassium channel [Oceanospirillaceae bacterium]|jgi:voltage-gated potassium channel